MTDAGASVLAKGRLPQKATAPGAIGRVNLLWIKQRALAQEHAMKPPKAELSFFHGNGFHKQSCLVIPRLVHLDTHSSHKLLDCLDPSLL